MTRAKPSNADGTRDCGSCGLPYPHTSEYFVKSAPTKSGLYSYCKMCHRAAVKRRAQKTRRAVLSWYSQGTPACACCGDSTVEFLVIDHIDGGGNKHRAELRENNYVGAGFYRWLRTHGYPEGYRVLCQNCNSAHGHYGFCPHTTAPAISRADAHALLASALGGQRE